MTKINFFIASSSEIKDIRNEIVVRVAEKNDILESRDVFIYPRMWEFKSKAIPKSQRTQDEYNKLVGSADFVAVIIKNKCGIYLKEEFLTALNKVKEKGIPKVVVYALPPDTSILLIPDDDKKDRDSFLRKLREGESDYFHENVRTIDALWNKISNELDRVINEKQPVLTNTAVEPVTPSVTSSKLRLFATDLSPKEMAILRHMRKNLQSEQIAKSLGISLSDFTFAKSRLLQKTGFTKSAELVEYAIAHDWL